MAVSIIHLEKETGRHPDTAFVIAAEVLGQVCQELTIAAVERMAAADSGPGRFAHIDDLSPDGWAHVSFNDQRGVEAALSGESLGPRDVATCPRLTEVEELRVALDKRKYAGLVGPSGSGKSLAIFHVAYDAAAAGTTIYRLVDVAAGVASLDSIQAERTLLLVDDAHSLRPQAVSVLCDAATDTKKVLFAGIDSIPGFVRPTIVDATRAVARLCEEMTQRRNEVRQVVQRIDRHIGEGYLDTPIERILEDAAKSKMPWQYMFVLGQGHLRCRKAVANLKRADRADIVLLIMSMEQIARYDEGIKQDELLAFAHAYEHDEVWLDHCLRSIRDQGLLFGERGRVMTPHPRLAMAAIDLTIRGAWSMPAVRDHLRELLVNEALPLRGRAWLFRELHFGDSIVVGWKAINSEIRTILHGQLTLHDGTDDGIATSMWMLNALIRGKNSYSMTLVKATAPWLVGLVHDAGRASAYALGSVVNEIHNADPDWGREFVADVDAGLIGKKLTGAGIDDFDAMEVLVDRLLTCATESWRDSFFALLDYERLAGRWEQWPEDHVYSMARFSMFLVHHKTVESRRLRRSMYAAIRRAFHSNVLSAWGQIRELVMFALGFSSLFDERPSDYKLSIAREIGELVNARDVGHALSASRQRDWEPLAMLVDWLRVVVPATWAEIATFVKVEPLLEQARGLAKVMPRDLEMMFIMLILDENAQPFRYVIVALQDDIEVLSVRFADLVPSVGIHVLDRGGQVRWGLSGGLPRWRGAAEVLSHLEKHEMGLAKRFLSSAVEEISDGLMLTQDNSGQHVEEFLSEAERVASEVLCQACARLDPEAARKHWSERVAGSEEARAALLEVLRVVNNRPGPAQSIAAELMARVGTT